MNKNTIRFVSTMSLIGGVSTSLLWLLSTITGITFGVVTFSIPTILAIVTIVGYLTYYASKDIYFKEVYGDLKFYAPTLMKTLTRAYIVFLCIGVLCGFLSLLLQNDFFLAAGLVFALWPVTFGVVMLYAMRSDVILFK